MIQSVVARCSCQFNEFLVEAKIMKSKDLEPLMEEDNEL